MTTKRVHFDSKKKKTKKTKKNKKINQKHQKHQKHQRKPNTNTKKNIKSKRYNVLQKGGRTFSDISHITPITQYIYDHYGDYTTDLQNYNSLTNSDKPIFDFDFYFSKTDIDVINRDNLTIKMEDKILQPNSIFNGNTDKLITYILYDTYTDTFKTMFANPDNNIEKIYDLLTEQTNIDLNRIPVIQINDETYTNNDFSIYDTDNKQCINRFIELLEPHMDKINYTDPIQKDDVLNRILLLVNQSIINVLPGYIMSILQNTYNNLFVSLYNSDFRFTIILNNEQQKIVCNYSCVLKSPECNDDHDNEIGKLSFEISIGLIDHLFYFKIVEFEYDLTQCQSYMQEDNNIESDSEYDIINNDDIEYDVNKQNVSNLEKKAMSTVGISGLGGIVAAASILLGGKTKKRRKRIIKIKY